MSARGSRLFGPRDWIILRVHKSMRILFITGSPPYPTNIGGNQLAAERYRALASQGEVDLFLAVDEQDLPPPHVAEIR